MKSFGGMARTPLQMKNAMVPQERHRPVSSPMKKMMRSTMNVEGILLHAILASAPAECPRRRPTAKNSASAAASAQYSAQPLSIQRSIAPRNSAPASKKSMCFL